MAKELTITQQNAAKREALSAIVREALEAEGFTIRLYGSGKLIITSPDGTQYKNDTIVPGKDREGNPFDGDALADDYEARLTKRAQEKAEREAKSLAKQAERKAKDEAKAKAKAEAEAAAAEE